MSRVRLAVALVVVLATAACSGSGDTAESKRSRPKSNAPTTDPPRADALLDVNSRTNFQPKATFALAGVT